MAKVVMILIVLVTISAIVASVFLVAVRPYPELGEVFKGWMMAVFLTATFLVEPFIKGTPLGRAYVESVRTAIRFTLVAPVQIVDRIFRRN